MTMSIPPGSPSKYGRRRTQARPSAGFTLLELMIAVVIVAILASIALPSYRSYVLRSNRAVVRAMLVDLAAKQEVEALKSGTYDTTFNYYLRGADATMNTGLTTFYITSNGTTQATATAQSTYEIRLTTSSPAAATRSFMLTATAMNGQTQDTDCSSLSINAAGQRLPAGGSTCWSR